MNDKHEDWSDFEYYINYRKLRTEIYSKLKKEPIDEELLLKITALIKSIEKDRARLEGSELIK